MGEEDKSGRPARAANPFRALREKLGGTLPPGAPPKPSGSTPEIHERVTVRRERSGRGGKTVTVAEGPGFTGRQLEPLAREAARALGVGARVEGVALVLQGDQADRLSVWLATRGFAGVERGN